MRVPTGAFVAWIFVSAFLLFTVQPMVAKMALPWFGGGPAVWNTSLLFFQSALLAGYAYSHWATTRLGPRRDALAHALVVLAPLAALPPLVSSRWAPAPGAWPVPALVGALAASAGLASFALAATSSVAQRWYARGTARPPYFLYAASNAGSLAALVAYPVLVEPRLGLRAQSLAWSLGYGAFALLGLACAGLALRAPAAAATAAGSGSASDGVDGAKANGLAPPAAATAPGGAGAQRARWLFRSTVTSLLLLAVTQRVASDVASAPLLWTVPLAFYLASYVLAFAPRVPFPRGLLHVAALYCVTFGMNVWPFTHIVALAWALGPPLGALFLGCWVVHGDLLRDRPDDARLTEFYLVTAAGGCLGGVLGNLAAPLAFDSVAEYPLGLAALAAALALGSDHGATLARALRRPVTYAGPALAAVAVVAADVALRRGATGPLALACFAAPALALVAAVVFWRTPGLYAGVCAVVAVFAAVGARGDGRLLAAERSFYSVLRVREAGGTRAMTHGTTLHGVQLVAPLSRVPGTYYHPATPMGAAVAGARDGARVGVVGLGTGSLAALLRPGQSLTFYELDPTVEPLARRFFTYLNDSRGRVDVVTGDARLTLARAPAGAYDLLVVDAFTSDAVPVHLLTLEAVELFLARVRPGGLVLFHVSHRYLDLARVLEGASRRLGLAAAISNYTPDDALAAAGVRANTVVALARDPAAVAALPRPAWGPLRATAPVVWTDDRSSVLELFSR